MRIFLSLLLLASLAPAGTPTDPMPLLMDLQEAYNRSDGTAFAKDFSSALQKKFNEDYTKSFFLNAKTGWGTWNTIGEVRREGEDTLVVRVGLELAVRNLTLRFDAAGKVDQLSFVEIEAVDFAAPPMASTYFRFPVQGAWLVLAAGDPETYQAEGRTRENAFALDLVKVKEGTSWSTGKETLNSQFASYDQEVTAPVGGKIVQLVDAVPENAVGKTNDIAPGGNALTIQFSRDEYLSMTHLRAGSFAPKVGQEAVPGAALARTGNSGATPRPKLTLNASDNILYQKGRSLKFGFSCVEVLTGQSWVRKENYSPATGDLLRPCAE